MEKQISQLAKTYADSLFEADENREKILSDLMTVSDVISNSDEFDSTMLNPAISLNIKFEIIDEIFKNEFSKAAMSVFGSGYAWLVCDGKKLKIITTKNQDTPLCRGFVPILNIDVWEHAYYLKHYNDRKAYIEDFIKVVNWTMAEKRLCSQ